MIIVKILFALAAVIFVTAFVLDRLGVRARLGGHLPTWLTGITGKPIWASFLRPSLKAAGITSIVLVLLIVLSPNLWLYLYGKLWWWGVVFTAIMAAAITRKSVQWYVTLIGVAFAIAFLSPYAYDLIIRNASDDAVADTTTPSGSKSATVATPLTPEQIIAKAQAEAETNKARAFADAERAKAEAEKAKAEAQMREVALKESQQPLRLPMVLLSKQVMAPVGTWSEEVNIRDLRENAKLLPYLDLYYEIVSSANEDASSRVRVRADRDDNRVFDFDDAKSHRGKTSVNQYTVRPAPHAKTVPVQVIIRLKPEFRHLAGVPTTMAAK